MKNNVVIRDLIAGGAIGHLTSAHIELSRPLADADLARGWRFDPSIAGAGLFLDLASHGVDLLDFLVGPITLATGVALNTGRAYRAEDVTAACFGFGDRAVGTGIWNFNADRPRDRLQLIGTRGEIVTAVFEDENVHVVRDGQQSTHPIRNPPHVHEPLIQTIVDELRGRGRCESTGTSGARASWVLDRCLAGYYDPVRTGASTPAGHGRA